MSVILHMIYMEENTSYGKTKRKIMNNIYIRELKNINIYENWGT